MIKIKLIDDFISDTESLFDFLINNAEFNKTMKSKWTASYGNSYNYNNMSYPLIPFPNVFTSILDKIENEIGFRPNNCLINLYHDGKSTMGYHSDNTEILSSGTGVAIISIGADRILKFKNKINSEIIIEYNLKNGSLFYMDDIIQDDWLHSITKSDTIHPRLSLTFRKIKENV